MTDREFLAKVRQCRSPYGLAVDDVLFLANMVINGDLIHVDEARDWVAQDRAENWLSEARGDGVMGQLQPIETAPKDGTPFLAFNMIAHHRGYKSELGIKGSPFLVMAWVMGEPHPVDERGDWHDFHCYTPTHWMPLPDPPEVA